jgi:hypothetical protein
MEIKISDVVKKMSELNTTHGKKYSRKWGELSAWLAVEAGKRSLTPVVADASWDCAKCKWPNGDGWNECENCGEPHR